MSESPFDGALAIIRADVPERLGREAFSLLARLLADEAGVAERLDARRTQAVLSPDSH